MTKAKKHVVFDCDGTLIDTSGNKYQLFPGIKELLTDLSADCTLYVWTARGRASTLRILKELGVVGFFDAFCTPDDCVPKPHVAGLVTLLGGTPKSSICVIGDSSSDMIGARAYGVLGIGAIWNTEAKERILKESGADFIVSHPAECSTIIRLNLRGENHV